MPKLLLADDSVAIQRLVELTFSPEHIEVTTASDGEDAIQRIAANPPDVVLADISMPKRNGYEVAAFVKGQPRLSTIPVLLLAGAFEPVDEARAAEVRCDGVLVKPFEPQQVIARVRELLGGAVGTPTRATVSVPRAVDRLTPLKLVDPQAPKPSAAPPPVAAEKSPLTVDSSLDNYFDRLDAAFATLDGGIVPTPSRDEIENPIEPVAPQQKSDFDLQPSLDQSLNQPLEEVEADVPTVDRLLGLQPPHERHRPAPDSPFASAVPPDDVPAPRPSAPPPLSVAPPVEEQPDSSADRSFAGPQIAPVDVPAASQSRSAMADAFAALLAVEQGDTVAQPVRLGVQPVVTDALIEQVTRRVLEQLSSDKLRPIVTDVVSRIAERLVREEIDRIRGEAERHGTGQS
jgi:CheY-like chemotaxis protein